MTLFLLVGADMLLLVPSELFWRIAALRAKLQTRIQHESQRPGWGRLVPLVAGDMLLGVPAALLQRPAALRAKLQPLIRQECRRPDKEAP